MIKLSISSLVISILFVLQLSGQSYSVPSPSASQMTKYSGTSVNESSGRVTASIPVYNYQAGNISLPISLQYVGNGVKIDQHSNWVGTNWLLNAGGVVTRVVNHLPDETAQNRLFAESNAFLGDEINNDAYINDLLNGINTADDLRPDVFSFSFPEGSGSFYLDKNNLPRMMNANSELKIEIVGGVTDSTILNTIVITTPTGMKYYFGGDNASESSSTMVDVYPKGGVSATLFEVFPKAITAFYLYKIVHPLGSEMLFEYHDDGDKSYIMFKGDRIDKLSLEDENVRQDILDCSVIKTNENNNILHHIYVGKIYNRKKIHRIYSPDTNIEIKFNSTFLTLGPVMNPVFRGAQYDDRVLNSIQVYNSLISKNVKQVKLDYITTSHRIFLEKVSTNNENDITSTNVCGVYKMEYDHPEELPKRFSKAQDLLSYYNSQTANISLIPKNNAFEFEGVFADLADRFANFEATKKGSLQKIYYPTGGYTSFEYEAPKVKSLQYIRKSIQVYKNQSNRIPTTKPTKTVSFGTLFNQVDVIGQNVPEDQDIVVHINIKTSSGNVNHQDKIHFELTNQTTGAIVSKLITLSYDQTIYYKTLDFHLEAGNVYTFKATIDSDSTNTTPYIVNAYVYYLGYESFDAYGIRVKRILKYPEDGSAPLIKRYYYKRAEKALISTDEDKESAIITYEPYTARTIVDLWPSCCPTTFGTINYSYVSLQSNPFSYFFASADNQVSYKYVTVSIGGDSFEEGGIEKQFRIEKPNKPELISVPSNITNHFDDIHIERALELHKKSLFLGSFSDNNTILNGALIKTTHIKNVSNILYKIKETEYTYNLQELDKTEGVILSASSKECLGSSNGSGDIQPILGSVTVANYNNFSYKFNLSSVTTKDYIDSDLPPVIPEAFQNNMLPLHPSINTKRQIVYGALKGLPIKVISTNSDGTKHIVKNRYLTTSDLNNLNGVSTNAMDAYNQLISQHRIASPIQVEIYQKKENSTEILQTTQRVLFKNYNGMVLQEKSMRSRFDGVLENQTTIHKYNNEGQPLEISAENDIKTALIYGYKDKRVIAELVNLSYDDIPIATINNLHSLAITVVDQASMHNLEIALDQLRTDYPQAKIKTYLYNKLGQIDSMKDNRGTKIRYQYDDCYRLKQIIDQDGNVIEEYNYNILNNNN